MNFESSEYYEVAKDLIRRANNDPSKKEGLLRTAIGRAYYSVFLKSRNYLRDKEHDRNIIGTASDHAYVREKFRLHTDPTRQEIGRILGILRDARNVADYEGDYPNLEVNAKLMVMRAGIALSSIDAL